MSGDRRVFIFWDAELDGPFRRRLERGLGELQVAFADASQVDHDPDASAPVKLAVVSPTGQTSPSDVDIVLLGGPGEFHVRAALRLEAEDIEKRTRRWIAFTEKLGAKIGRPGLARFAGSDAPADVAAIALAYPADPLAREAAVSLRPEVLHEQLAEMKSRAEALQRDVAAARMNESNAIRDSRNASAQTAAELARIAALEREVERLSALSEATAFALSSVPEHLRGVVSEARDDAWRARIAAAQAMEMAEAYPDALTWKNGARYSGETVNKRPHGYGVMVFGHGGIEAARYAGGFVDGRREGHGVGLSDGGLVWTGAWKDGEACGCGQLEAPDGQRFEGLVAADETGAPVQVRGWTWGAPARKAEVHSPLAPALPSPR